jgi:hypothetical protein
VLALPALLGAAVAFRGERLRLPSRP